MTSGTEAVESSGIVIPDICVDIIYRMDAMGNIITSDFVGINDRSFFTRSNHNAENKMEVFAIRFYAWGAYAFCEDSFVGTVNGRYDVREKFSWLDRELRSRLSEPGNLSDRIRLAETLFLKTDDPNLCVIRFTTERYSLFIDWESVKGEIDAINEII